MSRYWRCGDGHHWTGELGALLACPECGSADVYEVRTPPPEGPPRRPARAPSSAPATEPDLTLVLPAVQPTDAARPPAPPPAPVPTAGRPTFDPGDTLMQATAPGR